MRIRWLGWAGVELEAEDGSTLVVDPLEDAGAVFAPLGERAAAAPRPRVVPPRPGAAAGLVTHLHRDHADAAALAAALAPGAEVLEPRPFGGDELENLALAQAEHELAAADLPRRRVDPWARASAGPFAIAALPAADGLGDPQLSWAIEVDGVRVLHLGDTTFHGWWWRIARRHGPFDVVLLPVNGARISFPHRQPPSPRPATMDPAQAALAAELLGARLAVPIHAEGYDVPGVYEPAADPAGAFAVAAAERGVSAARPELGEALEVG
jgi:L-ascorbate metabolism protein UlaG (beta-lactamase superfamily)